jgi:hypothetical protein
MTVNLLLETLTKEKKKNFSINERIQLYENLENSLRKFFNSTNFCQENCFSKEEAVIGWKRFNGNILAPGNEGCCHNNGQKFYDFAFGVDSTFDVVTKEKETFQEKQLENIREDFCQTGTCDYHTNSGCAIEKLRSPRCNSWICPSYGSSLLNNFNISYSANSYSDNTIIAMLGIVFDKEIQINQIEETISKLEKATKRINSHKGKKEYRMRIKI